MTMRASKDVDMGADTAPMYLEIWIYNYSSISLKLIVYIMFSLSHFCRVDAQRLSFEISASRIKQSRPSIHQKHAV